MPMRDSDELRRARSLRTEADALVRIDESRRVLLHISHLLTEHPGDARLLAEEKAILVDISTHRAAAREAMRERGDNTSKDG